MNHLNKLIRVQKKLINDDIFLQFAKLNEFN